MKLHDGDSDSEIRQRVSTFSEPETQGRSIEVLIVLWGQLGTWIFHVCKNPLLLDKELAYVAQSR